MISSMTGYGRAEKKIGEGMVTAEIRTVNHRFLEFSIRLPRPLNGFEREIEKLVRSKIKRGHVFVSVAFDRIFESENLAINKELLRRAYRTLTDFVDEEDIPCSVNINTLLSLPEAFRNASDDIPPSRLWPAVERALSVALNRCAAMRRQEGRELLRDLRRNFRSIEGKVSHIEKRAPRALGLSLKRAKKRLENLVAGTKIDESRWAIEAAIMADRSDFSEELVRIKSHLSQFSSVLRKGGGVSKKLTFILQEIHREATTMANKAADTAIIKDCLAIKEGVEKLREQAQNVE
jgi:uncharacterized protein (TIGR00255 family)